MSGFTKEYNGKGRKVRVKDAFKEDAGRGIVRIDPDIIKEMTFKTGDVIEISHPTHNRITAALLYPGKREDKGTNITEIFRMYSQRYNNPDSTTCRTKKSK